MKAEIADRIDGVLSEYVTAHGQINSDLLLKSTEGLPPLYLHGKGGQAESVRHYLRGIVGECLLALGLEDTAGRG